MDLPAEMIENIISKLPVKPLCRFKCVSKPWRSLISDPDFVANYPRRRRCVLFTFFGSSSKDGLYSLNPDQFLHEDVNCDVEELGFVSDVGGWVPFVFYSSHALFLSYANYKGFHFSLNNPVTKESKKIPAPPIWRQPMTFFLHNLYGVGFDQSTNEYKVISAQDYDDGMVFSVYTLQTGSWRQINRLFPYSPKPHDGILFNGGLHWWATRIADGSLVILSFHIEHEEVREIPLPPTTTFNIGLGRLGAFRNWLCITAALAPSLRRRYNEIYVMKEYGVRESWSVMRVSISYFQLSHSGFFTESYDLMVFDRKSLVMYNFNDRTFRYLSISVTAADKNGSFGSVGTYLDTLPEQHERLKDDESTQ